MEKDLAIFGFFIALGRSTRSFLLSNGFDTLDDPVEDFIRYNLCYMISVSLQSVLIFMISYVYLLIHIAFCYRYLIVGSVLYYPELSSISSYQLYVEVSMYGNSIWQMCSINQLCWLLNPFDFAGGLWRVGLASFLSWNLQHYKTTTCA